MEETDRPAIFDDPFFLACIYFATQCKNDKRKDICIGEYSINEISDKLKAPITF